RRPQGAAASRARTARDAAHADPPAPPARARRGGRPRAAGPPPLLLPAARAARRRGPRGRPGADPPGGRAGSVPALDRGPGLMAPARPADGSGDLPIDRDPSRIEAMFGGIARRYDLMNRLMTVGLDARWRRLAAEQARLTPGDEALDVCCGT